MKIGWRIALLAMAIVALGLIATSWYRRADQPPNVLVIVVDTLRADRLGAYGYPQELTPYLDQLAARGVVFLNAYSTSSWTIPSVTSLFTSRYPSQHRVISFGTIMDAREVTFAERLNKAGYVGGGFSANFTLKPQYGYARGFQHWVDEAKPDGSVLRSDALAWLDTVWRAPSSKPVLLYLQFMEPHWPYDSREPFSSRFARKDDGSSIDVKVEYQRLGQFKAFKKGPCYSKEDVRVFERAYDAAVATLDDEIRLLFAELHARDFLSNAIVILTADHGEEFGEHGRALHGHTLYTESVQVPLILVGPDLPAGLRIRERVSLMDVAPTLLDLLGLPAEARFEGRSLRPFMQDGTAAVGPSPDVLFELPPQPIRSHEVGLIRGSTKVLISPDGVPELYDLQADPGELDTGAVAIEHAPALLDALRAEVVRLNEHPASPDRREHFDDSTQERLRALGYDVDH